MQTTGHDCLRKQDGQLGWNPFLTLYAYVQDQKEQVLP